MKRTAEKQFYVYKTTNVTNGMFYIGAHYGELDDCYRGGGIGIKQAVKQLGCRSFRKEVLMICPNRDLLWFYEMVFVGQNEVDDPMCYNRVVGGHAAPASVAQSRRHSDATKRQMSESAFMRDPHSDAAKRKMSESHKLYWANRRLQREATDH